MVTIHDVAKAAGVSETTVSLVLRGKQCRVSEQTRQRVFDAADQLHYVPNQVAVSLVTRKTYTIGLIYSDMLNPFYAELALGIERNAYLHDYSLLICNCDEQVSRCVDNITLLEGRCVDAALRHMSFWIVPSMMFIMTISLPTTVLADIWRRSIWFGSDIPALAASQVLSPITAQKDAWPDTRTFCSSITLPMMRH